LRVPINTNNGAGDFLVDAQTWAIILEPALCSDPAAADSFARLLFAIKQAINSGPDGIKQATDALAKGIELTYLYTEAHKAALRLYQLSLTGHLKPQDEPLQLINQAIAKGAVALELRRKTTGLKGNRG
jgi:hypothetical protein